MIVRNLTRRNLLRRLEGVLLVQGRLEGESIGRMSNGKRSAKRSLPADKKEFIYDEFNWRKSFEGNAIEEDRPTDMRLEERSSRFILEEFDRPKAGGNSAFGWLSGN